MHTHTQFVGLAGLMFAAAVVTGCPKKEDKPAPAPTATVTVAAPVDTGPAELVPVEEDAGVDAGDSGDSGKKTGVGVANNVARLRACCAQIQGESRRMGMSPEAAMLAGVAAQCNAMANQAGPNGTAPELGTLRNLLKVRSIPACQSF
jgi:hypothetical protein